MNETMNSPLFKTSFAVPQPNAAITPQSVCPSTLPLVLLPVRLETRFFKLTSGATELRIRVYPDRIHTDSHQPELTTDERTWGMQYWQQDWVAGSDPVARADAWRALANRFGAPRAAWIARTLKPTNLQLRPAKAPAPGTAPPNPPTFPVLPPVGPGGENAWRYAPMARLLPDRWTAIAHSAGKAALSVTGKDIRRPLAVGPDPQAPAPDAKTQAAIASGAQLGVDPGMKWLVDFDEAEAAGMAMRVTVPPDVLSAGIESLVVFGVSKAADPNVTAGQLADLFDAHAYTDGLEFLRFGSPTNNTDDQRAAYSSNDPDQARSFQNEVLMNPANTPNAGKVGAALGVASGRIPLTLGHLGLADQDHDLDQSSMNAALWQVGWGYFLTNMIGAETGLSMASVDWARGHFISYVRAGGPLPPLRVGRQPYGVLPVTSLDQWAPAAAENNAPQESWLKSFLLGARDKVWRPAAGQIPRVGLRAQDPDADLADVMHMDGVSHGNLSRRVLGRRYLEHLAALDNIDFAASAAAAGLIPPDHHLLDTLKLPSDPARRPHAASAFYDPNPWPIVVPLVQAGDIYAADAPRPTYISELLATPTIDALIARPARSSVLEALLRHAMLREFANAAARITATAPPADIAAMLHDLEQRLGLTTPAGDLATLLRDLELVDMTDLPVTGFTIQPPALAPHWKRQLAAVVPPITGTNTIRAFLEGLRTATTFPSQAASLGKFRAGLTRLASLDPESLQNLMQSTLDLSSHRLDAWITSFATKRLAFMTSGGKSGQYVGGYGWVENLVPAADATPVPDANLPAGETGPLFVSSKDSGFIHAPSVTHASAAALLRNAHLGPSGVPGPNDPFAIDMSSRRAREAQRLLDGVRQGQPLGALLGYRLERRLHDLQLETLIAPLRAAAPLVVRDRGDAGGPVEALAANNVVDGLVLAQRWQAEGGDPALDGAPFLDKILPAAAAADKASAKAEIKALLRDIDGLSDTLVAEVAYQMARGNSSRLGGVLSAIASGDALPPELEVTHIPRSGTSITHRVMVMLSGAATPSAGWAAPTSSPLAGNEPVLNAWVSRLLGDASKARCTIEQFDPATGAVVKTIAFPLSELGLTQLDFVYGIDDTGGAGEAASSPSYVEQLVLYQAQRRVGGFGAQANLRLKHARPTDLAAGELTLLDLLEQGRLVRRLLETARGARPDDLAPPERPAQGTIDLADLEARIKRGEDGLRAIHTRLDGWVKGAAATAEDLRTDLLALGAYGVRPASPRTAVGDTPDIRADLLQQAAALLKISGPRLDQAAAAHMATPATAPRDRCLQLLAYGQAVFGGKFVLLPKFSCDAAAATELKNALGASTAQQGGDPLAAHAWFTRTSQVRAPVARLGDCLRGAEVLATGDRLALSVAQLPFNAAERWVGLAPLAGGALPPSKLSMVIQSGGAADPAAPLAGLLIDEWVEVVPNASETTAVTFQFDPPNSFAPQAVLVAVPPVAGQDWTTETLRQVLVETLDLAKLRGIDAKLLGAAAQYLPGVYIPFNASDHAVSTDFAPLTR